MNILASDEEAGCKLRRTSMHAADVRISVSCGGRDATVVGGGVVVA